MTITACQLPIEAALAGPPPPVVASPALTLSGARAMPQNASPLLTLPAHPLQSRPLPVVTPVRSLVETLPCRSHSGSTLGSLHLQWKLPQADHGVQLGLRGTSREVQPKWTSTAGHRGQRPQHPTLGAAPPRDDPRAPPRHVCLPYRQDWEIVRHPSDEGTPTLLQYPGAVGPSSSARHYQNSPPTTTLRHPPVPVAAPYSDPHPGLVSSSHGPPRDLPRGWPVKTRLQSSLHTNTPVRPCRRRRPRPPLRSRAARPLLTT